MARFSCPQCGRGFGSVGEMLNHTERVHAGGEATTDIDAQASLPARGMPSPEPGPVATERARQTGFETESAPGEGGTFSRSPGGDAGEGEEDEQQNPTLGTLIALIVIAAIVLLNILAGGE